MNNGDGRRNYDYSGFWSKRVVGLVGGSRNYGYLKLNNLGNNRKEMLIENVGLYVGIIIACGGW